MLARYYYYSNIVYGYNGVVQCRLARYYGDFGSSLQPYERLPHVVISRSIVDVSWVGERKRIIAATLLMLL